MASGGTLGIRGWLDDYTTIAACLEYLDYFGLHSILLAASFKFITATENFKRSPQPFAGLFIKTEQV